MKDAPQRKLLERKLLLIHEIQQEIKYRPNEERIFLQLDSLARQNPLLADRITLERTFEKIREDLKPDFDYFFTSGIGAREEISVTVDSGLILKKYVEDIKNEIKTGKKESSMSKIYYDSVSGSGSVDDKDFKFKDHQPEYRVFAELYKNMNKKLLRYDILVLAHVYEDGEEIESSRKTLDTGTINDIAKEIRKRAGLNTKQLILNNGNLTLVGQKG